MSTDLSRSQKAAHIRQLLREEGDAVSTNTRHFNQERYAAVDELGDEYKQLKTTARSIKEESIERLPELIETLTERVEANGGHVYVADTAADANQYIQSVSTDVNADTAVKSKSMTSEEIEVNDALCDVGCDVYETDLGELVIQIANESPSHLIGPSLHKSREEIATLFNEYFDPEESLKTAEDLTNFARDYLADRIHEADLGMTGANFIVAETGSIALVTNEGNARKTIEATDTHIAVAGVEKIIPTLTDLHPFIELIGRSGTGQSITAYNSIITPPINTPSMPFDGNGDGEDDSDRDGEDDGDHADSDNSESSSERDFHLVLIDNGRMEMRNDDVLRETLYCIRCGACANSCANFQSVGGHAFGGETYTGGIATGWESGIYDHAAEEFNDLCTGCSRCVNACPVKIDIPWINTAVRDRINSDQGPSEFEFVYPELMPDDEPDSVPLQKRFFGNFATIAKLGSKTAPMSNWLGQTETGQNLLDRWLGIVPDRNLPKFERQTLTEWFESRSENGPSPTNAARRAVLYPDLYTNHVDVERGKAAVRTLEALGVAVEIPDAPASGRAPLSQGMVTTARNRANEVYDALSEHIKTDKDIVVIEPSDLAMFRRDYEHLLSEEKHTYIADNSYELFEYVYGLLTADENRYRTLSDSSNTDADADMPGVLYHSHCQQRTLGLEVYTKAVLDELGYNVTTSDVECCGMAGSFGYKSQYYELSMDVGEELKRQFCAGQNREKRVLASGTSCTDQLDALLDRTPEHPIELIAP
jgi:L-lactate utilization protein LutB